MGFQDGTSPITPSPDKDPPPQDCQVKDAAAVAKVEASTLMFTVEKMTPSGVKEAGGEELGVAFSSVFQLHYR